MASSPFQQSVVTPDTMIQIKVTMNHGVVRKLKLPFKDLGAATLPEKLRQHLDIKPEQEAIFERFSDSAGSYIVLDPSNPAIFKTLIRAAKAKLKLRIKVTLVSPPSHATSQKEQSHTESNSLTMNAAPPAFVPLATVRDVRHASQQTLVNPSDADAPNFELRDANTIAEIKGEPIASSLPQLNLHEIDAKLGHLADGLAAFDAQYGHQWSVYCNECDKRTVDTHFHCNICDKGDFDLCAECVEAGKLCPGEGHWLIKRFVKDGVVTNSTTERISPRSKASSADKATIPVAQMTGASPRESAIVTQQPWGCVAQSADMPSRTCNNCIAVLPEHEFVNCTVCEDFDLCTICHDKNTHGHHPGHTFEKACENTTLSLRATAMLSAGRNVCHDALCDACNAKIYGIRHKCQTCPDFDLCSTCVKSAPKTHPRHRFAPLYEQLSPPQPVFVQHFGVYCDGPNCRNQEKQSYIIGPRYKCAVCNDTDFCGSCEASPHNMHNRTHPVILFKTPIRDVKITTQNEDVRGNVRLMGDREPHAQSTSATQPTHPQPNMKTNLQVLADFVPTTSAETPQVAMEKCVEPVSVPRTEASEVPPFLLNAHFVRDTVVDGTEFTPGTRFTQIWTLRNPGPHQWPSGCSVRFVGGDNMLDIDNEHPLSTKQIAQASESNVIGRAVRMNEEIAFRVTLKAPLRMGKAISYWRLKSADGVAIGHRLWCHVNVRAPLLTLPIRNALPHSPEYTSQIPSVSTQSNIGELPAQAPSVRHPDWLGYIEREVQQREQLKKDVQALSDGMVVNVADRDAFVHANEKARKDAAKQRVEFIKAKILKAREERVKQLVPVAVQQQVYMKKMQAQLADQLANDAKTVDDANTELNGSESQMVFPKLDKESPESSTYQSLAGSQVHGETVHARSEVGELERMPSPVHLNSAATPPVVSDIAATQPFEDLTDELEILSAHDDFSDSDDGFLTDEEYDILDASDRETVASP